MLCSTALHKYRDGIVARRLLIRPRRLSVKFMRDDGLRVAVRHVQPIRECPDSFRGFTLVEIVALNRGMDCLSLITKKILRRDA
jgi:hypothetical protein